MMSTDVNGRPLGFDLNEMPGPNDFNGFDPNKFNHQPQILNINDINFNFTGNYKITLWRPVQGSLIPVDAVILPVADTSGSSWKVDTSISGYEEHSYERDITINRCIRRVWNPLFTYPPTLGQRNNFIGEMVAGGGSNYTYMMQAHPANKQFTNIGEIGQLFRNDAYNIGQADREYDFFDSSILPVPALREGVRVDLTMPVYQNLFKYLTVMDPNVYTPETRIKGRININTAPWFVLAQLPWLSYHTPNYDLARSIVSNRDTYGAFKNTGELMRVGIGNNDFNSIGYYVNRVIPANLLTPADGAGDAFEERDVIFDRISNLITVRSDVFTAYILVRIGTDGPQKRVIAILDRSGVTPTAGGYTGKVKVIAVQQVPDPR
jgi:hypothetical protein